MFPRYHRVHQISNLVVDLNIGTAKTVDRLLWIAYDEVCPWPKPGTRPIDLLWGSLLVTSRQPESLLPGWDRYLGIHRQRANDILIEVNAAPPSSRAGGERLSEADLRNSASALAVVIASETTCSQQQRHR